MEQSSHQPSRCLEHQELCKQADLITPTFLKVHSQVYYTCTAGTDPARRRNYLVNSRDCALRMHPCVLCLAKGSFGIAAPVQTRLVTQLHRAHKLSLHAAATFSMRDRQLWVGSRSSICKIHKKGQSNQEEANAMMTQLHCCLAANVMQQGV